MSLRWSKLRGDLRSHRGRVAMMAVAIAVGVAGVGAMLTARSILVREIARSYAATVPASATLELDATDPSLVELVRHRPDLADAEARAAVLARVRVGDDWLPLLLFVIDDFSHLRLNRFAPEAGAWPPPAGGLLLERSAVALLRAPVGTALQVKTPHGRPQAVTVAGLVHDAGLAPAWQERTGYAYITRETLQQLGEPPVLAELRIRVAGQPRDRAAIEQTANRLADWLQTAGHPVHGIQIPPPGRHPHQGQMEGVLALFTVFSALTLALAAIMVATVVAGIMAAQVREIGMMKAVGARTRQIAALYVLFLATICATATGVALPVGFFVGRMFARMIATMLNFDLATLAVPAWVFAAQIGAGLLLPLAFAAFPVLRASRASVRATITDYGVNHETFGRGRLDGWLGTWEGRNRLRMLALRNLLRRRGRLLLSLGLLTASGGMFMTALNVRDAWRTMIARVYSDRFYDVEVRFNRPEPVAPLRAELARVPGLRRIEAWGYAAAAFAAPGRHDVSATYPDGGHGSFTLMGAPPATALIRFPLLAGRWLRADDTDGVVLNHLARALKPGVSVGDRILLSLEGRPSSWRVVGVVEEVGSPAAAYATDAAYARAAGTGDRTQMLRIASAATDAAARVETIRQIEQALARAGASVRMALPLSELRTAIGDHVLVLVGTLVAMAGLLAVIGLLGLASTMRMNVMERTRELGVLKAIGAKPRTIVALIVTEGVATGALSWLLALPVAAGLSLAIGRFVGAMAFRLPLPLTLSYGAMAGWLGAVLALAALASAVPAWQASRLTEREALAYG